MKNPMIENSINAELFEAIDENAVNGGASNTIGIRSSIRLNSCIFPGRTPDIIPGLTKAITAAINVATVVINQK